MSNNDSQPTNDTPEHGYWMSLTELAGQAPAASGDEFPADSELASPLSRRSFFQLMGASMALAGVAGAGCKRYEKEEIVPLARRSEDAVPGVAQKYASAFELGGVAQPLVVTSYEGRPIHVEGNADHPFSGSDDKFKHAGTSTFAQASVLHLYDPDRDPGLSKTLPAGKLMSVDALGTWWTEAKKAGGAGIRVLAEATSSPTVHALKQRMLEQLAGAQWYEYEAISWDNEREGTKQAFGRPLRAFAHLDRAHTVVTLDADIFVEHPAALRYSKDFAKSRRPNGSLGGHTMNRLWSVESAFTNTGAVADHRLPVRSELVLPLVMALDAAINGGAAPTAEFLRESQVTQFVQVLVEELQENKGKAVLIAGRRQPAAVHALVAKINAALSAPLEYIEDTNPERTSHLEAITKLTAELNSGAVKSLIILGGNPVFDAPADLDFAAALAKAGTSVHVAEYANETTAKATSYVPRAHYLEAWSDARAYDGTVTIAQPLIAPLYGSVSMLELVAMLAGEGSSGETLLKKAYGTDLSRWRQIVHDGFVAGSALPTAKVGAANVAPTTQLSASQLGGSARKNGELEVTFVQSGFSYDGRFANNAWLQETPDFLTKVTWDNYAMVAPATANDLGLKNDTIISVAVAGKSVEVACYVMPGQAKGSIALVVGGGRSKAGVVGGLDKKTLGFNVYPVRTQGGFDISTGATVKSTGKAFALANVQEHWDFRAGIDKNLGEQEIAKRAPIIVKEVGIEKFSDTSWTANEYDGFHLEQKRGHSLFDEQVYNGHRWGMSIDLGTCTGCNSCMVACQSENNIPVVGKEQVMKNREMGWIRIDRYFTGSPDNPGVAHQPVGCQQCEMAPCEQVCPVGATVHSDEGLNDMAYNRCVGTRYCLNNCPYRVRRFNFLDYHQEFTEARSRVRKLLFNPEVTVRHRGVMEKCSYCVQRIQNAKIQHKTMIRQGLAAGGAAEINAPLPDGAIVTACQAACPTEAIVFGDLQDKESRVSKLHEDRRSYDLLADLYTKPRTRFMTRVRNPHPKLAKAQPAAHHGGAEKAAHSQEGGH